MTEQKEMTSRQGLIIWLADAKYAKQLERYGSLHYVSKRQSYAVLYVHSERTDDVSRQVSKLQGVKKVEHSKRNEIWELYTNSGIAITGAVTMNALTEAPEAAVETTE